MVYVPTVKQIHTMLDEAGIRLGLKRLPNESLVSYRQRLLLQSRDPSGPTQKDYVRTLNRKFGFEDIPIFSIVPKLVDGYPLAPNPKVVLTSSVLTLYSDDNVVDVEIDLRPGTTIRFLMDVEDQLSDSIYFDIDVVATDYRYWPVQNLMIGGTEETKLIQNLYSSFENNLDTTYIRSIGFYNSSVFAIEKSDISELLLEGDYFVDYFHGIVFSKSLQRGGAYCTYDKFPYVIKWQWTKPFPLNCVGIDYRTKDSLVGENGLLEYSSLNSYGANVFNEILAIHSSSWGK